MVLGMHPADPCPRRNRDAPVWRVRSAAELLLPADESVIERLQVYEVRHVGSTSCSSAV